MRHALAVWLHQMADTLDHTHTVHTAVDDHDGVRTVTVTDHGSRLRASYDPHTA